MMLRTCNKIAVLTLLFALVFCDCVVFASDLPLPRYASIRSKSANMRNGPAKKYPILWEYTFRSMPVEIIAEHEHWRKVVTPTGEKGWFHVSLLSSVRTAMFRQNSANNDHNNFAELPAQQTLLYRKANTAAFPVARVADGSVGKIIKCNEGWCKMRIEKVQGWVQIQHLWGVKDNEEIK